jgi:hypothetical protein
MTQQVKTLTLNEYLPLALKTKADLGSLDNDHLHSVAGLFTEVGELVDAYKRHWFYKKDLDRVNLKEEIGDILWYIAIGLHALEEVQFPEYLPLQYKGLSERFLLGKLTIHSAQAISQGYCYDNEDWRENFSYCLINLLKYLECFAETVGTSLQEAAYLNIVKLAKRYPEGFTEFNALHRDTVNELSHIES